MKILTLLAISCLLLAFSSCQKECDRKKGIVGKWKLIEEVYDPGDGSGTFQSIESDKTIKFCQDGTFEANGEVCFMGTESGSTHTGTYDTSTNTISPDNCISMMPMSIGYSVSGNRLIISYPCNCGCQQKYKRV